MSRANDLTGKRFGRLTVIERAENNKQGRAMWICGCDCGNITKPISGTELLRGNTKSCGCLRKEMISEKRKQQWQDEEYRANMSGENHPNYNPDLTDEERKIKRKDSKNNEWSKQVKENANYTCDCCGKSDCRLNSHHLNDYHSNKELRYDIDNGVCLCEHCHREFHENYMNSYKEPCTKDDYEDFKEIKQNYDIH